MRYMLLLFGAESDSPPPSTPEAAREMMVPWWKYNQELKDAGVYLGGDALQPSATATTLKADGSAHAVIDGPFAETKEQIGGYYMIDCADLDEALKWAAKCPILPHGSVEVRPLMELPNSPDEA